MGEIVFRKERELAMVAKMNRDQAQAKSRLGESM